MSNPNIKQSSFEKVAEYFLGGNWRAKFPIVKLAIRHPKINAYEDELAMMNTSSGEYMTMWWNTQPASFFYKGKPTAILKYGYIEYELGYHKKWDSKKRSIGLRPKAKGERIACWRRKSIGAGYFSSFGVACNCHGGGSNHTWSLGCQTCHPRDYDRWILFIAEALGVKLPTFRDRRGKRRVVKPIRRANQTFLDGIGTIPYLLISQEQFNYIVNLPREQFDSAQDLAFQAAHFVNMPKFGQFQPTIVELSEDSVEQAEKDVATDDEELTAENIEQKLDAISTNTATVPVDKPTNELETDSNPETVQDSNTNAKANSETSAQQSSDTGQSPPKKVAIEKPLGKGFISTIRTEISAIVGGNIAFQAVIDALSQVKAIGLSQTFWIIVGVIVLVGSAIYLIYRWFDFRQDAKRDLELTHKLIDANSTADNQVYLVDKEHINILGEEGFEVVRR